MRTLYKDRKARDTSPFYRVEVRATCIIATRTARRIENVEELRRSFGEIDHAVVDVNPADLALLVDVRGIVGRNDPDFEKALGPLRRALLGRFGRAGLLVRTLAGKLQLERYFAIDALEVTVFSDADEAEQWLERQS